MWLDARSLIKCDVRAWNRYPGFAMQLCLRRIIVSYEHEFKSSWCCDCASIHIYICNIILSGLLREQASSSQAAALLASQPNGSTPGRKGFGCAMPRMNACKHSHTHWLIRITHYGDFNNHYLRHSDSIYYITGLDPYLLEVLAKTWICNAGALKINTSKVSLLILSEKNLLTSFSLWPVFFLLN